MFLQFCTLDEDARKLVVHGVNQRWVKTAAAYLIDSFSGKRILEAFVQVDWVMHSDLARLTPTVVSDLPGWEAGAAPEIRVLGHRFGHEARQRGGQVRCWVDWAPSVRADPDLLARAERELRVSGFAPPWKEPPSQRMYSLLDLPEQQVGIRSVF